MRPEVQPLDQMDEQMWTLLQRNLGGITEEEADWHPIPPQSARRRPWHDARRLEGRRAMDPNAIEADAGRFLRKEMLRLMDQSLWANREWIEYVYSRPDAEARPRELLAHVVLGQRVWFDRVAGTPRERETFLLLAKDELRRALEENERTWRSLIAERLEGDIPFRRASGEEYHARVTDVLHHLVTEAYHHRGQLAAHYARKGTAYPNTDHIHYLMVQGL